DKWASDAALTALTLTTFRDVPWNAPWYEARGFRVLDDDELTPGLRQRRAAEDALGLEAALRVVMRREPRALPTEDRGARGGLRPPAAAPARCVRLARGRGRVLRPRHDPVRVRPPPTASGRPLPRRDRRRRARGVARGRAHRAPTARQLAAASA